MSDDLLRVFERQLDQHHKTLGIYSHPREVRLFALLAAYDFTLLSEYNARLRFGDSVGIAWRSMRLQDSLSCCLRWLCQQNPGDLRSPSDKAVFDSAAEFLLWGCDYASLADAHLMYARGLADVEIDTCAKNVRFVLKPEGDRREIDGYVQVCEFQKTIARQNERRRRQLLSSMAAEVSQINTAYHAGRICVSDITQLMKPTLIKYIQTEINVEILPLDPTIDLGGFSFGEYRQFWQGISNWSNCLLALYDLAIRRGIEELRCAPTQLLKENDFVSAMTVLSGLPEPIVSSITGRLTYDFASSKADIWLKPFLRSNGSILWSPRIIRRSRYQRNMLKLMARTPALKNMAASIIGRQEGSFVNLIGNLLSRKAGYQFKTMTRLSTQSQEAEIDLIAYQTKTPSEVLVVEAKTLLPADEVNEVSEVTNKLTIGQGQIENALGVLKSMGNEAKQRLFRFIDWNKVREYYPLLMTPDTHPDTRYDDNVVPHISYTSLRMYPRPRDLSKPSRLWSFCKSKQWIKEQTPTKQCQHRDIRVADIIYTVPLIEMG